MHSESIIVDEIDVPISSPEEDCAVKASQLVTMHVESADEVFSETLSCAYVPGDGGIQLFHKYDSCDANVLEIDADQAEWLLKALPAAIAEMRAKGA